MTAAPTHEVVAIVSAPASLAERLAAVDSVRALADMLADAAEEYGAERDPAERARSSAFAVKTRAELHAAIDALAGITPADRARSEGR